MMGNWKTCQLGDLITFQRGHDLPKSKMKGGIYPVVGSNGIIGYHDEYTTESPSITIGRSGNVGKPFLYKGRSWSHNTSLYIREYKDIDPIFIYYFLQTLDLGNYAGGSAVPTLNRNHIHTLTVTVPVDKNEQRQIASVLSVLDDKIEQNTEINENLAEQAQGVLYHFMDKQPYQLQPLSDIAIVIDCLHSKKPSSIEDSIYQLIQLDNIRDDGFLDMSATRYMISQADYINWTRKCEIVEGDCVITNVGRIGAVSQAPYGTKAAMGRNMTCIRLKPGIKLQAYFITVLLSNHMRRQIQSNTDEGTIMGALNVKNIPKLLFPIFEPSVMTDLEGVLFPLRKQIEYNNLQNQTLAQLRDYLLPKLMSGELDVSELAL